MKEKSMAALKAVLLDNYLVDSMAYSLADKLVVNSDNIMADKLENLLEL